MSETQHLLAPPVASADATVRRVRLFVEGVVQGVGFRPYVWRLAGEHGLSGLVRNTSGGVVIEVEGDRVRVERFTDELPLRAPALAVVTAVRSRPVTPTGEPGFRIDTSVPVDGQYQPIAPDAAPCADCLRELLDPADRRHRYPFINCTNCGPRFTIIEDIPYDRPLTTMRHFTMCPRCRSEYDDPADRRFHAQPNACPACGPRLWWADRRGVELPGDAVDSAAAALRAGEIVALKGLGGFHLACDASDSGAVARLRERKRRPAKPFAVMVRDLDAARGLCEVSAAEAELLEEPGRPVVLLVRRRARGGVAEEVAPGLDELGLMLPSTPLHHMLLGAVDVPLVMTSGNVSEEPIAKDNDEAVRRLGGIADAFLLHDRDIYARYDDSVARVVDGEARLVRRARGYCPLPVPLAGVAGSGVALGAHLKNTFSLWRDGRAFVGPHIGDLDHPLSLEHEREAMRTYARLFRAAPGSVACDLHPDYASTRLAEEWALHAGDGPGPLPLVPVQHHHAHVASVMAEHGLRGRLIGVAFDGVGFGTDGSIWGGEFLVCDETEFERAGHLVPVRQPGGDLCAREGWRMAAAYIVSAGEDPGDDPAAWLGPVDGVDARRWRLVCRLAASDLAPLSTSAGRLFDAAASLLGVGHVSTYEAEAAMRLEAAAAGAASGAWIDAVTADGRGIDGPSLLRHLAAERRRGRPVPELAAVFHESLARAVVAVSVRIAGEDGLERVALSGGVFQNARLLRRVAALLRAEGLAVYANRRVPANDGGISLGQALVAGARAGARAPAAGAPA